MKKDKKILYLTVCGKTYVTKGYEIMSELRAAGYKEDSLFVPFSNSEEIVDPVLIMYRDTIISK